jgi:hypothetical protein
LTAHFGRRRFDEVREDFGISAGLLLGLIRFI